MGDDEILVESPDILIVEGLNVLQPARLQEADAEIPFISDFLISLIYIDAETPVIESWYIDRFLELRRTAFNRPGAYFARYADLDDTSAIQTAKDIWTQINQLNLEQNILPTRWRADLILHKNAQHQD